MPARSTMLTGQYVRTHGVVANGVPLPDRRAQRRRATSPSRPATAPRCSARPTSSPASTRSAAAQENRLRRRGRHRPVARLRARRVQAMHAAAVWGDAASRTTARWLRRAPPRAPGQLRRAAAGARAAATPARPRPRTTRSRGSWYHTDWVADLTIDVARLARRRRRLVLLDELPRPAPPVGPAGVGAAPRRRGRTSTSRPATPGRDDAIREVLAEQAARTGSAWCEGTWRNRRGRARRASSRGAHPRPDPRDQRQDPRDERAHRRGVRPGARRRRRARLGSTTPTCSSPPTTASCRATSACCSRARSTPTRSMRLPFVWRPAPSAGVAPARGHRPGRPGRPGADVLRDRRRRAAPTGCRARRCRPPTASRAASGCCASGTASSPATACTCGRSTATAGCAPPTSASTGGQPNGLETFLELLGQVAKALGSARRSAELGRVRRHRGRALPRRRRSAPVPEPLGRPGPPPGCATDLVADLYDSLPPERDPKLLVERPA